MLIEALDDTTLASYSGDRATAPEAEREIVQPPLNIHLPKYLIGVSGGSWFTAVYTYADARVSDLQLLGVASYRSPDKLTRTELQTIPPSSMLLSPTLPAWRTIFCRAANICRPERFRDLWQNFVWKTYLEPNGISVGCQDAMMAWGEADAVPPRFGAAGGPAAKGPRGNVNNNGEDNGDRDEVEDRDGHIVTSSTTHNRIEGRGRRSSVANLLSYNFARHAGGRGLSPPTTSRGMLTGAGHHADRRGPDPRPAAQGGVRRADKNRPALLSDCGNGQPGRTGRSRQPYPIIGTAMVSPARPTRILPDLDWKNLHQFVWTECTPLYCGVPGLREYHFETGWFRTVRPGTKGSSGTEGSLGGTKGLSSGTEESGTKGLSSGTEESGTKGSSSPKGKQEEAEAETSGKQKQQEEAEAAAAETSGANVAASSERAILVGGFFETHGWGSSDPARCLREGEDSCEVRVGSSPMARFLAHRAAGDSSVSTKRAHDRAAPGGDSARRASRGGDSCCFPSKNFCGSCPGASDCPCGPFVDSTTTYPEWNSRPFSLARAIAHSSWVLGSPLQALSPVLGTPFVDEANYWTPLPPSSLPKTGPQNTLDAGAGRTRAASAQSEPERFRPGRFRPGRNRPGRNRSGSQGFPQTQTAGAVVPPIPQTRFVFGDGGSSEDTGIPAAIRRGARRIIAFIHDTPLAPKTAWDPEARLPSSIADCSNYVVGMLYVVGVGMLELVVATGRMHGGGEFVMST